MNLVNIYDFETLAAKKLHPHAFDYYFGGADDEITLRENCDAFKRIFLKYRVLRDVSKRDLTTNIIGQNISMPLIIAPTAFQKMANTEGEIATVKAAGSEGTIMILSTLSNSSFEEVTEEATGPVWFQLYVFKDREVTKELIQRAESAGVKALVLTVDAPFLGQRERDVRNKFDLPPGLEVKNLSFVSKDNLIHLGGSGLAGYIKENIDPSLNWKDIDWLRTVTNLPIIIKGINCKEDALIAVDYKAEGIVVSNHGGRQLDTCKATIDILSEISDAVNGETEILMDGGIRRGTDILKALALGAKAVLTGRPVLWGLACNGEKGVKDILNIFRKEFDLAMSLCGLTDVKMISKEIIHQN